jgi:hypothetical protein
MKQGFVLEATYGGQGVSHWGAGAPMKSFWTGAKASEKLIIPIGTFRCASCGYLESYARDEFAAR